MAAAHLSYSCNAAYFAAAFLLASSLPFKSEVQFQSLTLLHA
jgi:hypothetical protein